MNKYVVILGFCPTRMVPVCFDVWAIDKKEAHNVMVIQKQPYYEICDSIETILIDSKILNN